MHQRLFDFLDDLKGFAKSDDIGWHFINFVQSAGARGAHIWFAAGSEDAPQHRAPSSTTYSQETLQFMAEGLDNVDSLSLARQVALSTLPLRLGWDIERQIFEKGTDDHRLADTLLNSDGRRNAVVVPIPTRDKFGSSGLGIYSDEEETLFDTWWTEQQTTLLHAAIATHLTMQDRDWVSACMKLAPREVECIKWLSKGLRTKQIANKLNLSDAAVSLYLKNARRKMNVATREALVAKCFMAGLI